jgi:hypothetical protein
MQPIFGACGIYCELCPLYRNEKCEGCFKRNEWFKPPCTLVTCTTERGIKCCFECEEFPCETHYKEDMVYSQNSLNNWKKLMLKPKDYFIQVKERFKKEG